MTQVIIPRPAPSEYPSYYSTYIDLVPEGDILHHLFLELEATSQFLETLTPEQLEYRYAPDKWSVKEVLGHLTDSERIFACRALCFARGETADLPGFDQDAYVVTGRFDDRDFSSIIEELTYLRKSSIALFKTLDEQTLAQTGTADGKTITVRSIPYILIGHELHHINVIKERYFG